MIESIFSDPVNLVLAALLFLGAFILAAVIRLANQPSQCDHRFIHAVVSKKVVCSTCHADVSGDIHVNVIWDDPIVDFLDWWSSYPASKLKSAAIPDPPVMIQNEMHDLADLYQSEKQNEL